MIEKSDIWALRKAFHMAQKGEYEKHWARRLNGGVTVCVGGWRLGHAKGQRGVWKKGSQGKNRKEKLDVDFTYFPSSEKAFSVPENKRK